MAEFTKVPFVQAYWYTKISLDHPRKVRLIVMHSMEAPEKPKTAENVADYFKQGCPDEHGNLRKASAHYCVDSNSVVQCVQTKDIAFGAPNANSNGLHIELAGYAAQSGSQWHDDYSKSMLRNAAQLCGSILVPKYSIDVRKLSLSEVQAAQNEPITGFCTHADVTKAFHTAGGHTDPGPNFPMDEFLLMVKEYV